MYFEQIAIIVEARLDNGEYWQGSLVRRGTSLSPLPTKKTQCHTLADAKNQIKSFNKDFEPRPSLTGYDNGIGLKDEKKFDKDFEPRPSLTGYDNGKGLEGKKSFNENFEPRPSATGYDNGTGLKGGRMFDKDFEPRPSATGYDDKTKFEK